MRDFFVLLGALAYVVLVGGAAVTLWTRIHAAAVVSPALNDALLLDAIADVESGNNPQAIGPRGERGRCQFMAATWRELTNAEFLAWAPVDCPFTRGIERAHLARICRGLHAQRLQLEPAFIAAAWRFGLSQAVRQVRADSAQRTANLYWAKLAERKDAR